jgi:hypothetical protein
MNKLSSPDAEVKQQHTWLSFKAWIHSDTATEVADPLLPRLNSSNDIFENLIDLKKSQYHFGVVVTAQVHM